MALEAAIFSQDPLLSYCCSKDLYPLLAGSWNNNYDNFPNYSSLFSADDEKPAAGGLFDPYIIPPPSPPSIPSKVGEWDRHNYLPNSSPETRTGTCGHHQYRQLVGPSAGREVISPTDGTSAPSEAVGGGGGGGRRKRRRGSTKNKEEVENQRMTHIAVERNRRKQMNEYLAAIKSMMPPPYVQRGDQASIIGGAIDYVKELEQRLHSLESQKRMNKQRQKSDNDSTSPPIFADFFTFPQFSRRTRPLINHQGSSSGSIGSTLTNPSIFVDEGSKRALTLDDTNSNKINNQNNSNGPPPLPPTSSSSSCGAEIEVTMVETHANVKILVKRQPKQLLKLVTSFQNIRLSVLHLNLTSATTTTVDNMVLYTFSLKVEEGSQFNSVEEIAAAANHILEKIQRDSNPAFKF